MAVLPIQLRPTFPMDDRRIQRMKRELIWKSPRLIIGQALGRIAATLKSAGFESETGLVNRCLDWWSDLDQDLTAKVMQRLIAESNIAQDDSIQTMIRHLERGGQTQYAISLGRVLLLKQHIERGLHRDGLLNHRREEIESLVDSICQEVCNELFRIAESDESLAKVLTSRDPQQLEVASEQLKVRHARIMHAYASLHDTASQLAVDAEPVGIQTSRLENEVLDRLIENLREESETAKAIEDRIRTELPTLDRE